MQHNDVKVWDTPLAIAEYLNEIKPKAGLLPADMKARAHCRAICGEMHSGFGSLRGSLPMNIKAHFPQFKVWSRAQADIDRVIAIWEECLATYGGPYLFGKTPPWPMPCMRRWSPAFRLTMCRFPRPARRTPSVCWNCRAAQEWVAAAKAEPEEIDELDAEF